MYVFTYLGPLCVHNAHYLLLCHLALPDRTNAAIGTIGIFCGYCASTSRRSNARKNSREEFYHEFLSTGSGRAVRHRLRTGVTRTTAAMENKVQALRICQVSTPFCPRQKGTSKRFFFPQKFVFFVVLFTLVAVLLVQTYKCLEKFFEEPTYVSTDVVAQNAAEFPALTVCPDGSGGYKEDVLKVL